MKKFLVIALIMFLSAAPSRLLAKGATTKVVIEGPNLSKPIEITDRKILANFNVWTGPGTFSTQPGFNANAPSLIIDWSQGPIPEVPNALQKYQSSANAPSTLSITQSHAALNQDMYIYPASPRNGGGST